MSQNNDLAATIARLTRELADAQAALKAEEAARVAVKCDDLQIRLSADGLMFEAFVAGTWWNYLKVSIYHALASLLPRKPVDTKLIHSLRFDADMIRSIRNSGRAVDMASLVGTESVLREAAAALEAVASDLTAPVAVAAPSLGTPDKGWLVMNRHGYMRRFDSLDDARQYAKGLDLAAFGDAPHVVYALHRVPDTETPPND